MIRFPSRRSKTGPVALFVAVFALFLVAILFILCIPLLTLLGLALVVVGSCVRIRLWWTGRRVPWEDARLRLAGDFGSVVVEANPNTGDIERVWLLDDRIGKLDPSAPWPEFRELQRQLWDNPGVLTVPIEIRRWCDERLKRIVPRVRLIVGATSRELRPWLNRGAMPIGSFAVVPSPQVYRKVILTSFS